MPVQSIVSIFQDRRGRRVWVRRRILLSASNLLEREGEGSGQDSRQDHWRPNGGPAADGPHRFNNETMRVVGAIDRRRRGCARNTRHEFVPLSSVAITPPDHRECQQTELTNVVSLQQRAMKRSETERGTGARCMARTWGPSTCVLKKLEIGWVPPNGHSFKLVCVLMVGYTTQPCIQNKCPGGGTDLYFWPRTVFFHPRREPNWRQSGPVSTDRRPFHTRKHGGVHGSLAALLMTHYHRHSG